MAFGGPTAVEEVEDFLSRFLGGRPPPKERIEEVKRRYRLIGGGSPLPRITLSQARALEEELARRGHRLSVFTGLRFSEPFVKEAVASIGARRIRNVLVLPLTPFRSKLSTAPYFTALDEAMKSLKVNFDVIKVMGWHTHPLFLEAWWEKVAEGLSRFDREIRRTVRVIFSAHSLPTEAVATDSYVEEIHETIEGLWKRMEPMNWYLAFQSKGGGSSSWLEPDVGDVLEDLARSGCSRVLVVPVGFVSDHLETLYDLDILYRRQAEQLGIEYERSASLNDSPKFIEALAQVLVEYLDRSDVCDD